MQNLLKKLGSLESVQINSLKRIHTPREFFQSIKSGLKNSSSAFLACLYFGNGEDCLEILDLIEARSKLRKETVILVDENRNKKDKMLIDEIEKRNIIHLFKFVDFSVCRVFPFILNEFLVVYHTKAFIFDDEVVITGANLEDSYFSTRSDRYMSIKSHELSQMMIKKIFDITIIKEFPISSSGVAKDILQRSSTLTGLTTIFPFDHTSEISLITEILKLDWDSLAISTSYLNFPSEYLKILENKKFDLFATSPETNTFNGFGVLNNLITSTYAYSNYYTKKILKKCILHEYSVKGNTFHKKGIWMFHNDYAINVIGSSNFNRRSIELDIECSFLIVTNDKNIIKSLKEELEELKLESTIKTDKEIAHRRFYFLAKLIFWILNKFI